MENSLNYRRRGRLCLAAVLLVFAAYTVRLFDWQIVNGAAYLKEAESSLTDSLNSSRIRGEIYSADGKPLAVNRSVFDLYLNDVHTDKEEINNTVAELLKIFYAGNEKWIDVLPIEYKNNSYGFSESDDSQSMIKFISGKDVLNRSFSTAAQYISGLAAHYSCEISDKKLLRDVLSVRVNMDYCGFSSDKNYLFAEDISREMTQLISESSQKLDGAEITSSLKREYKNSSLAPHVVGAVGKISAEEYAEQSKNGYGFNDIIGKFGIEQAMETELRGGQSKTEVQKNKNGSVINYIEKDNSSAGNTVYLTLDSGLQETANKALEYNVKLSRGNGSYDCVAGAAVMIDVRDFSVLAAAAYPSYDLAKYSDYGYYEKLINDDTLPLYSRAFEGAFAPGSVFKPCVALAGLEEKKITPESYITCTREYDYYPTDIVRCMGYHGAINMNSALAVSCNYYFAELGRRLGRESLFSYAEKFGLGLRTGVEISEGMGFLAGRDSVNWTEGNTVQAAIGQSDNAFTPAQLAVYAAVIANNGVRLRAHLVRKTTAYDRGSTVRKTQPEVLSTLRTDGKNLKAVQKGMRSVCSEIGGTAYSVFGNYGTEVAGKTGTAENSGTDHTVFICYAPFDKPQVAVAVVIEHGAYGTYSTAVAKALLDKYFYNKKYDPQKNSVDEAGFVRH